MCCQHVLFDLDGTLTDSLPGISNCFKYALERLGVAYGDITDWRWIAGPPLIESFGRLLPSEVVPRAVELYRERFAVDGWRENSVYDGVYELLDNLAAHGIKSYIATGKPEIFARKIAAHFALEPKLHGVAGALLHERLHKPEVIAYALDAFRIPVDSAIMVGDRDLDLLGAKANNIPAVGVSYGFGDAAELLAHKPEFIAASPLELSDWLIGFVQNHH